MREKAAMIRRGQESLSILEIWFMSLGWLGSVLRPQKLAPSAWVVPLGAEYRPQPPGAAEKAKVILLK
jgi:hypothetical protein